MTRTTYIFNMNRLEITLKDHPSPCDVTLVAKNGKLFKSHRHVLSEASSFFEKLFSSNMKESKEGIVRLEVLTESQMAEILEFIYTGNVEISTQQKAEDSIAVADYLLLESLKPIAQKFLEQNLSTSNCISNYYLGERYICEELITSCRKFIHLNFATVAESDEFMNLPSEEVEKWISSDEIVISEEEDVFKIILRWIAQDENQRGVKFCDLFRHVRLTCMSRDFLVRDVVTNDFVGENEDCLDGVTGALKWLKRRRTNCRDPRPHSPRKVHESCVVVACGEEKPFNVFCYLPGKDEWYRLPRTKGPAEHVVSYRGQLFVIYDDIDKSQCYDPDMNHWSPAPWAKMNDPKPLEVINGKYLETVLVVKNEMCFIVNGWTAAPNELWKYNLETNSMSPSFHWVEASSVCAVAADKYIYAIGGNEGSMSDDSWRVLSEAARFDTVENKWEKMPSIQQARYDAFGTAGTSGRIFIAGGVGNDKRLRTCEVYDILTDEWQFTGKLSLARYRGGNMVSADGTLYVLGGRVSHNCMDSIPMACVVESYDPEKNRWNETEVIPADKLAVRKSDPLDRQHSFIFKASSLRVFKGALNKLKAVGDSGIKMLKL